MDIEKKNTRPRIYFAQSEHKIAYILNNEKDIQYIVYIQNKLKENAFLFRAVYTYPQLPLGPLHNLRRNTSCVKLQYILFIVYKDFSIRLYI